MPVSVAIATSDDEGVRRALQEAYERNDLRGKSLIRARRFVEQRRARGKRQRRGQRPAGERPVSAETVLRTFQQETLRQKLVVGVTQLDGKIAVSHSPLATCGEWSSTEPVSVRCSVSVVYGCTASLLTKPK